MQFYRKNEYADFIREEDASWIRDKAAGALETKAEYIAAKRLPPDPETTCLTVITGGRIPPHRMDCPTYVATGRAILMDSPTTGAFFVDSGPPYRI